MSEDELRSTYHELMKQIEAKQGHSFDGWPASAVEGYEAL